MVKQFFYNLKSKVNNYKSIIIFSVVVGILTYGSTLFNKYSVHDDTSLFELGGTFGSGRWMLAVLGKCVSIFCGSTHYSTPLFNGIITILFMIMSGILLLDMFSIKNKYKCFFVMGSIITLPAFVGLMGYVFTAPYFLMANFLAILGCYFIISDKKKIGYLIGVILIACSIGVYQSNFSIVVSVILLYFIKEVNENKKINILAKAIKYFVACIFGLVLYMFINKIFLILLKIDLYDYRGINTYGITSLNGYIKRVILSYKEFILPSRNTTTDMHPGMSYIVYEMMIIMLIICGIYLVVNISKRSIFQGIIIAISIIIIPIAINLVFIICDPKETYTLMMNGSYMTYVYFAVFIDIIDQKKANKIINYIGIIMLSVITIICCRYANICYLKADIVQEELKSYYTTLVTRIQSTEYYDENMKVVYIGEFEKNEDIIANISQLEDINVAPWTKDRYGINEYAWARFMKVWCGYDPILGDEGDFKEFPEVEEMPSYPNDGSIKIINDTIVVKFN